MLYLGMTTLSGIGCAAAVAFAAHSPLNGRREAVGLACLLFVNWALFILAYTEWAPVLALDGIDINTTSVHLWMIADAACGSLAAIVAFRFKWGKAIWVISLVQVMSHGGVDSALIDPVFYTDILLNLAFAAQLAVFFATGGGGVGRRLRDDIGRRRDLLRSRASAYAKATPE